MGNTIEIRDREGFPAKVADLRRAADEVRTAAEALSQVTSTARMEASSFTADGSVAPVYAPLITELERWQQTLTRAAVAACDSVNNVAATAEEKFNGITATDDAAAATIQTLAGGPAPLGGGGPGPGNTGTQTGQAGLPLTREQLANPGLTSAPPRP